MSVLLPCSSGVRPRSPPTPSSSPCAPGQPCANHTPTPSPTSPPRAPPTCASSPQAFDHLTREYPTTRDGLSLTERRILAAVDGQRTAAEVFQHAAHREARPDLGDTWSFATMHRLAHAPEPLLTSEPSDQPLGPHTRLHRPDMGTRVLAGQQDHLTRNGIDCWIGGVHLSGHHVPGRFDEGTETIEDFQ